MDKERWASISGKSRIGHVPVHPRDKLLSKPSEFLLEGFWRFFRRITYGEIEDAIFCEIGMTNPFSKKDPEFVTGKEDFPFDPSSSNLKDETKEFRLIAESQYFLP